jgi:sulfite reductase (NADPH) hemoprotein beta-component
MSGCINACAHHHVADIGILGVDKKGEDWYQISLGGSSKEDARLGKILGRSVPASDVAITVEKILTVYVDQRREDESFAQLVQRVGIKPFKERVYATAH